MYIPARVRIILPDSEPLYVGKDIDALKVKSPTPSVCPESYFHTFPISTEVFEKCPSEFSNASIYHMFWREMVVVIHG